MPKSSFTLTLLGTDTEFTPEPTVQSPADSSKVAVADVPATKAAPVVDRSYLKGETLSMLSTLMGPGVADKRYHCSQSTHAIVQFKNDRVSVIRGPETKGGRVGNRILHSLLEIFEAVKRGQTTINIMSHSRGAVEALLVAHELQRIKDALKQDDQPDLYNLLCASECKYTKTAVTTMRYVKENAEPSCAAFKEHIETLKAPLLAALESLELNLFAIDPVPGNELFMTPLTLISWYEERMHVVPPIVKWYEGLICENEYTNGFSVLPPQNPARAGTFFRIGGVPGHHGTASGNYYDQTLDESKCVDPDGWVQQLTLVKLIEFLQLGGVDLQPAEERIAMKQLIDKAIHLTTAEQRSTLKLDIYEQLQTVKKVYELFKNTNYKYLRQDTDKEGKRWIITRGQKKISLDRRLKKLGDTVINEEHAALKLHNLIGFAHPDKTPDLASLINALTDTISAVFAAKLDGEQENKILALLVTDDGRKTLFDYFQELTKGICESYLNKNANALDKQATLDAVKHLLLAMDVDLSILPANIADVPGKLKKIIIDNLRNSLAKQYAYLLACADNFIQGIMLSQINPSLSPQIQKSSSPSPAKASHDFMDESQYRECDTVVVILTKCQNLYVTIEGLRYGLKELSTLEDVLDTKHMTQQIMDLHKSRANLIFCAAKLAHRHQGEPSLQPFFSAIADKAAPPVIRQFVISVQQQAIALGSPNLVVISLQNQIALLEKKVEILRDANAVFVEKLLQLRQDQAVLERAKNEADKVFSSTSHKYQEKIEKLTADLKVATREHQVQDVEVAKLLSRIAAQQQQQQQQQQLQQLQQEQQQQQLQQLQQLQQQQQQEQLQQLHSLHHQNQQRIEDLQTPKEITCSNVIHETLLPALAHYRQYLEAKPVSLAVEQKLDKLALLEALLNTNQQTQLPSERIDHFYKAVQQHQAVLASHRDSGFKRLLKLLRNVALVLVTGILPGLIVMPIYAASKGYSPAFWRSKGKQLINQITSSRCALPDDVRHII